MYLEMATSVMDHELKMTGDETIVAKIEAPLWYFSGASEKY